MNTIAEFTIIGRVGEIRQVGTTLRVNIASSFSRKDNRGEWVEGGFRREVQPRRQHWFLNEKSGFLFRTPAFCSVSRG